MPVHSCDVCKTTFHSSTNRLRHLRNVHGLDSNDFVVVGHRCEHPNCREKTTKYNIGQYRQHLQDAHDLSGITDVVERSFSSRNGVYILMQFSSLYTYTISSISRYMSFLKDNLNMHIANLRRHNGSLLDLLIYLHFLMPFKLPIRYISILTFLCFMEALFIICNSTAKVQKWTDVFWTF